MQYSLNNLSLDASFGYIHHFVRLYYISGAELGMLNTVKNYWADVSSVNPKLRQNKFKLWHSKFITFQISKRSFNAIFNTLQEIVFVLAIYKAN